LFRYIEDVRPTLLMDEGESFIKDNEEMRGILNSGHTRTGASVIRNVEVNGQYKARRFSTWAPKAIATIRTLPDTIEDRSIAIRLQRKPRGADVVRLRKRDNDEFALLRRQAARWAQDNFSKLTDPDPDIPDALNDRAADNWRPLIAIADLVGGDQSRRARDVACLLSGEGHDSASINVELLADCRSVFGDLDIIRSTDLVAKLTADLERPWAEWKHGKPLTQKQLAGLLRPFGIISERVESPGLPQARGYKRAHFEEAWEAYCPGQMPAQADAGPPKRHSVRKPVNIEQLDDFRSVRAASPDGSKNAELVNNHRPPDTLTDQKSGNGDPCGFDHEATPPDASSDDKGKDRTCVQCRGPVDGKERQVAIGDKTVWLHPECERFYRKAQEWEKLVGPMPGFLDRARPRLGPLAMSSGPEGDLRELQ
jgi:putative DNA primase/helicase